MPRKRVYEIQPYQHIKIPKGRGVVVEIKDKGANLRHCHLPREGGHVDGGVVSGGNIVQVYEVQHR